VSCSEFEKSRFYSRSLFDSYDGTAIAYATLKHLADTVHCFTFFVTHYPILGTLALAHSNVGNAHMSYIEGETNKCI
jgi:DNA mismatch repair ATPase MutS